MYLSASELVDMDFARVRSSCAHSSGCVGKWVLRLLMPMSGCEEGLAQKWTPACNPPTGCYYELW